MSAFGANSLYRHLSASTALGLLRYDSGLRPLCSEIGRTATVTGSIYAKSSMRAIVAPAIQLR
jgi:hypothetical protein